MLSNLNDELDNWWTHGMCLVAYPAVYVVKYLSNHKTMFFLQERKNSFNWWKETNAQRYNLSEKNNKQTKEEI